MSDVILYKEDIDKLNSILQALVSETKILSAFLINKDTRLLAHQGTLAMCDMSALAALIVGSFASTQAIAGIIGEHEFATMSHYGKSKNLLISLVDDNTIIAAIFGKAIPVAVVSSSIERHTGVLQRALAAITRNMENLFQGPAAMPLLSQDDVEQGFDSFFDSPVEAQGFAGGNAAPAGAATAAPEIIPVDQKSGARETQEIIPPPETKHLEYASVKQQAAQPSEASAAEEILAASQTDKGLSRNAMAAGTGKTPQLSKTEYLYFTSMNYLKNKAKEGAALRKRKNKKDLLSRLFDRSMRDS